MSRATSKKTAANHQKYKMEAKTNFIGNSEKNKKKAQDMAKKKGEMLQAKQPAMKVRSEETKDNESRIKINRNHKSIDLSNCPQAEHAGKKQTKNQEI